jgi:hypothetical protein
MAAGGVALDLWFVRHVELDERMQPMTSSHEPLG